MTWGATHRMVRDTVDLPGNGGLPTLGLFRNMRHDPRVLDAQKRRVIEGGDSYIAVVEFTRPVRAQAAIIYGNASQPGSPHRVDQLGLAARKELRPVWRTRAEIAPHVSARDTL